MVSKGCTFGLEHGPCFITPSVAVWTGKTNKRKTWTCTKHDHQMDTNLRRASARSGYRRQAVK